ncbi:uncharacterized protein EAF01_011480 [Botrytis porri]|uniref:uncharacterized protein n=1 Tax=Botrytis porri TaxID=87229 RepID=UPI0019024903|nr:uncharacterized protein EAF01_011480 [Botrytis porri]KAF7884057.1 hypothetical protein EAF01_011480 [Botrytis porri]
MEWTNPQSTNSIESSIAYHSSAQQSFPPPENVIPTFPKFKLLSPELRMLVFKEAIPDRNSQVVDFYFAVCPHPSKFLVSINDEISPVSHLLPLLNACKLSREMVHSQLKHIKLSTPDPHGTMRRFFEGVPIRHFWANDRHLVQTYIDSVRDTLMINIADLVLLSYYRTSIDFSNVERLAITSFLTDFNWLMQSTLRNLREFLNGLFARCPDVKVLWIVSDVPGDGFAIRYRSGQRRGYHLIDLDIEMWYDNYWDNSGRLIERSRMHRIQDVLVDAEIKESDFFGDLRYLQEIDYEGNFKRWKGVKLTIAFLCELDTNSDWETLGKQAPEPRLYCFSFDAWIPDHEDGSPLNQYKGLAQIFEEAPW